MTRPQLEIAIAALTNASQREAALYHLESGDLSAAEAVLRLPAGFLADFDRLKMTAFAAGAAATLKP